MPYQDQTGGLQFFHNGNWMDVPVVEHGLVTTPSSDPKLTKSDRNLT